MEGSQYVGTDRGCVPPVPQAASSAAASRTREVSGETSSSRVLSMASSAAMRHRWRRVPDRLLICCIGAVSFLMASAEWERAASCDIVKAELGVVVLSSGVEGGLLEPRPACL
jgi:hypothetical protein